MKKFAGQRIPESFNVLVKELQSLGLAVELEKPRIAQTIDAEDVLEMNIEAEANELGSEELLEGDQAAEGEAVVNLASDGAEDDFEALAEGDTTLTEQEGQRDESNY